MREFASKEDIEAALVDLGRQMALHGAGHKTVLCCGAAALCALDVLSRSTLDVDALGEVDSKGLVVPMSDFPPKIATAVAATARNLGLTDDWFNLEASAILERGLPDGSVRRSGVHAKAFGMLRFDLTVDVTQFLEVAAGFLKQ